MGRRAACLAAGVLWVALGVLAVLTVFGPILGIVLGWLVGVRRSVTAARAGAALGVLLFLPCQLIIDVSGCRHDACGPGPYVLAYGLPTLVVALNLAAGWRAPMTLAPGAPSAPVVGANEGQEATAASPTVSDPGISLGSGI